MWYTMRAEELDRNRGSFSESITKMKRVGDKREGNSPSSFSEGFLRHLWQ